MVARPQILVVDDDREMVFLLKEFLTRQGYDVAVANSGQSALRFFGKGMVKSPEIVVSDVKMSPVNGLELATALQAHQPNLPVILFSAYANGNLEVAAEEAGAIRFLRKPFGLLEIADLVKEELEKLPGKK